MKSTVLCHLEINHLFFISIVNSMIHSIGLTTNSHTLIIISKLIKKGNRNENTILFRGP